MRHGYRPGPGASLTAVLTLFCGATVYLQHAAAQTRADQAKQPASQPAQIVNPTHSMGKGAGEQNGVDQLTLAGAGTMVKFPVSNLHPGGVRVLPDIANPVASDPDAVNRGMRFFNTLNCVGCHAPNGGGGMGPSLSNRVFIYGSEPAQIYLSISQGRPHGMPSWGTRLPPNVIWDLVAYVQSISQAPQTEWGETISATSPSIEQVPAEYQLSTDPWAHTQPFGHGQNPEGRKQ
jgi:cytochrome c oxidase cbb3-type subunit 3